MCPHLSLPRAETFASLFLQDADPHVSVAVPVLGCRHDPPASTSCSDAIRRVVAQQGPDTGCSTEPLLPRAAIVVMVICARNASADRTRSTPSPTRRQLLE